MNGDNRIPTDPRRNPKGNIAPSTTPKVVYPTATSENVGRPPTISNAVPGYLVKAPEKCPPVDPKLVERALKASSKPSSGLPPNESSGYIAKDTDYTALSRDQQIDLGTKSTLELDQCFQFLRRKFQESSSNPRDVFELLAITDACFSKITVKNKSIGSYMKKEIEEIVELKRALRDSEQRVADQESLNVRLVSSVDSKTRSLETQKNDLMKKLSNLQAEKKQSDIDLARVRRLNTELQIESVKTKEELTSDREKCRQISADYEVKIKELGTLLENDKMEISKLGQSMEQLQKEICDHVSARTAAEKTIATFESRDTKIQDELKRLTLQNLTLHLEVRTITQDTRSKVSQLQEQMKNSVAESRPIPVNTESSVHVSCELKRKNRADDDQPLPKKANQTHGDAVSPTNSMDNCDTREGSVLTSTTATVFSPNPIEHDMFKQIPPWQPYAYYESAPRRNNFTNSMPTVDPNQGQSQTLSSPMQSRIYLEMQQQYGQGNLQRPYGMQNSRSFASTTNNTFENWPRFNRFPGPYYPANSQAFPQQQPKINIEITEGRKLDVSDMFPTCEDDDCIVLDPDDDVFLENDTTTSPVSANQDVAISLALPASASVSANFVTNPIEHDIDSSIVFDFDPNIFLPTASSFEQWSSSFASYLSKGSLRREESLKFLRCTI